MFAKMSIGALSGATLGGALGPLLIRKNTGVWSAVGAVVGALIGGLYAVAGRLLLLM